jgi:hypothetical protein
MKYSIGRGVAESLRRDAEKKKEASGAEEAEVTLGWGPRS